MESGPRIAGTRVYVTRENTPESSIFSIREFQRTTGSIAEEVVILMIPSNWSDSHRVIGEPTLTRHEGGLWEISVPHGYMVDADVPASLMAASQASNGEFTFDPDNTFYIFPKPFLPLEGAGMPSWQRHIFAFLVRNVVLPDTLKIPPRKLIIYFDYIEA
jgi:K+ transporter